MKTPAGQEEDATGILPAQAVGDDPFGFSPWLKQVPEVPLHALMANPVTAMAATTALGFSIAGQMAGGMLSLMQNAAERAKVIPDDAAEAEPAKAKPILTVVPSEPAAKAAREESATPEVEAAKPERETPAMKVEASAVTEPKAEVAREESATPEVAEAKPVRETPAAKAETSVVTKPKAEVAREESVTPEVADAKPVRETPAVKVEILAVAKPKAELAREESATPRVTEAKPVRKGPAGKAARADDLKAISGVGPKLEQVLNGMGLRRYADIAGLTPADVARIEAELGFAGRIARDGWVEQAKALAKGRG